MMYLSLLLSFVLLSCASYTRDVPLFVWSGDNFLTSRNEQIRSSVLTTESVGHFIQALSTGMKHEGPFSQHLTEASPELIVVFFDRSLSTEEIGHYKHLLPTLEHTMKNSPSFYAPYVKEVGHLISSSLKAARTIHKEGGNVYFMGKDTSVLRLEKVTEAAIISSFSDVLSSTHDGKTDLLCVVIEEDTIESRMKAVEAAMSSMTKTFETAEFNHFVAILVGTEPSLDLPLDAEMGIPESAKRAILQAGPTPPPVTRGANTFNTYFNGVFWELLAVLLVFWGVVWFGTMKLLELQAPDRLPVLVSKQKKKD